MNITTTGPTGGPPPQLTGSPLTLRRQLYFWTGALIVFIALLWLLGDVLMPFVAGMALAYLLDPLVRRLQRLGLSRAIASVVVVMVFICIIALALILLLPVLAEQIADFVARVPQYVERLRVVLKSQSGLARQISRREDCRRRRIRRARSPRLPQAGPERSSDRSGPAAGRWSRLSR